MFYKRRVRERKEISSPVGAREGFLVISIIVFLQSCPSSLADYDALCEGKPMGWSFEDPSDCTGYFACIMGVAEQNNCDAGQKYDPNSESCVVGKCPVCKCESGTTTSSPTASSSTPSPSTASSSTELSSPSTETSPTTTKEPTTVSSSSSEQSTECPVAPYCQPTEHNTFHRDRKDCKKYYVCRHGEAIAYFCIKGMYFDVDTNVCNYAPLVSCTPNTSENCATTATESLSSSPSSTESPTPSSSSSSSSSSTQSSSSPASTGIECSYEPYCKPTESGTFHRDRRDCRKYYVCLSGKAMELNCDSGKYFDEVNNSCNFESSVQCVPCGF